MDINELRVKIQSLGINLPQGRFGRQGGAGPAEGRVIIIDGHYISVPTNSWYVKESPYEIVQKAGSFILMKKKTALCEIQFPCVPEFYDQLSGSGTRLEKIALLHGKDCLASTIYQDCCFIDQKRPCSFCGIGLSLKHKKTVKEKNAEELGYAASKAKHLDHVTHVTLTMGNRSNPESGIKHLIECVKSIKNKSSLPVHVQVCPADDQNIYESIRDSGADTIGIHIESCSLNVLKKIAPAKAELGIDLYLDAWRKAVSVFGRNQVSSFLIAGIGDDLNEIIRSAELMCEIGVYPYVLPLRPVPNTPLEKFRPPDPVQMIAVYKKTAELIKENGLSSNNSKAGCVRCGVCSAITEFDKI